MKGKVFLKHLLVIVPFLLFGGLSLYFFVFSTPEKIVDVVGVTNGYVFISILAFLGGLTTFSGVPYHLILITLSLGGLNPFLLGFSTSIGVMLCRLSGWSHHLPAPARRHFPVCQLFHQEISESVSRVLPPVRLFRALFHRLHHHLRGACAVPFLAGDDPACARQYDLQ